MNSRAMFDARRGIANRSAAPGGSHSERMPECVDQGRPAVTSADEFRDTFLRLFAGAWTNMNEAQQREKWCDSYKWSNLMIYDHDSIIRRTAKVIGMCCWPGEPFRLDAVFYGRAARR